MKRSVRVVPALAASVAMIPAAIGASEAAPQGTPLLPDLDQEMPTQLVMTKSGKSWRLGFRLRGAQHRRGPADHRRPPAVARQDD